MTGLVPSTNSTKHGYVRKAASAIGVKPTSPAWQTFFKGSFGIKASLTRGRSNDIRGDGQAGSTFLTDMQNGGPVATELKYRHLDDFIEAGVKGIWANAPYIAVVTLDTEISDVSTTALTVSAGGASFVTGHLTRTLNFPTVGNNKLARVSSSTSTAITYPAATFTAETNPIPVGASVRAVGFQGATGDLVMTTTGGNAMTSTALDFTTLGNGVAAGRRIFIGDRVAGSANSFNTAACNGWARISAVAAHRLSFDVVPSGFGPDAGAGKTIQCFFGDFVKNGTTVYAFDWEGQQQDIAVPAYEYFYDDVLNNMTMTLTGGKEITMSMDFIGNLCDPIGTTRYAGSSDVAAPTYGTMTATSNVGDLTENNVSLMGGINVMSAGSIKISNNVQRSPVVGPLGSAAINIGELSVSGTCDTFLADTSIMSQGIANTLTSFGAFTGNNSGDKEGYYWDVPAIRITPDSEVSGKNQGRKVSGPWEAEPHPTLGYTISVGRFWYLP